MPVNKTAKAFVIASTQSSSGKTVISLGIMEALRKRGLSVQAFKAGPDYIDPMLHREVLKRPSYNLDAWMMGAGRAERTLLDNSRGADISVVEGVMGLFDGKAGSSGLGSTAHVAKLLKMPVLLVINASKAAQSVGAVIKGFKEFDKGVDIRWVVFNMVGSAGHCKTLKGSIPKALGVKAIGCVPRHPDLILPERHLGLVTPSDIDKKAWSSFLRSASGIVERHVDIDLLLESTPRLRPRKGLFKGGAAPVSCKGARIAVAMDNAFCFYYEENLEILKGLGADIVFFSPIKDRALPGGINGIYIGGGYPELHAKALEGNQSMRREIRRMAERGMPVYAECGGLMYLGRHLKDSSGKRYRMAGVFPWTVRMRDGRKALGYREARGKGANPYLKPNRSIRGHEFHHSEIMPFRRQRGQRAFGLPDRAEGHVFKNTVATYLHLHFASNVAFASNLVRLCAAFQPARK